jgi:hypothetical protein
MERIQPVPRNLNRYGVFLKAGWPLLILSAFAFVIGNYRHGVLSFDTILASLMLLASIAALCVGYTHRVRWHRTRPMAGTVCDARIEFSASFRQYIPRDASIGDILEIPSQNRIDTEVVYWIMVSPRIHRPRWIRVSAKVFGNNRIGDYYDPTLEATAPETATRS